MVLRRVKIYGGDKNRIGSMSVRTRKSAENWRLFLERKKRRILSLKNPRKDCA